MNSRLVSAVLLLGLVPAARADWLHYRGPTLNGVGTEKLPAGFKEPKQLWKVNVGTGTAAVTVSGNRAFTTGNYDKKNDVLVCLDTANGKGIWRHEYPQQIDANMFEGGPRATPTIDGDRVYALAADGDLFCLETATGKVKWHKHVQRDFAGQKPGWGYSGSPTVSDNLLLIDAGGSNASTVALDKMTGELVWKSGSDSAGYASPVVANIGGRKTVVMFKGKALVGLDAKDGRELWRADWKTEYEVNASTPIVFGNSIFVSSGYGTGAAVFDIGPGGAVQKWKNKSLRSQINTPVIHQGAVFGFDGNTGTNAYLVCLDLNTGTKRWEERSMKGGSLILAVDKLICLTEKGELVVCDANPNGFKANLRSQVLDKRCWVQPTLSGGKLFVKNNAGDLACYELK